MLIIKQVTMKSGATKWAIKDALTRKTVPELDFKGMAYFDSREAAEEVFEDYLARAEAELS